MRKDFRIGILGSGFIVNDCHLVAYRKAGFNPVAIASRNREHATTVAQKHKIPRVCDSYEQLLNDPGIEVLDIAVSPSAQLELIQMACARKTVKGILAQKPLGMNYAEAVQAVMDCQAAGITLAVNQNMRYDQSVRAARTLLENGTIGEPVFATIEMRAVPHWMDWHRDLGWLTLRIMSIHHLDTFRYWFGDPEGIYCSVRTDPRTAFEHADGICTYILEYKTGLRCVGIDDAWAGPVKEGAPSENYIRWRIEGTNGLAIGDIGWCKDPYTTPSTIRYATKGMKSFECPTWTESWFPDAFIGTMAQLLIALETNTEPAISGRDNLLTMALVEAAYESVASGRTAGPKLPTQFDVDHVDLTPGARQVLDLSLEEALRLNHDFIGTEHLLLGLIRFANGSTVGALTKQGVDLKEVRDEMQYFVGRGPGPFVPGPRPYTPRVKRAMHLASGEARMLGHTRIAVEHVLLGLILEGEGVAAKVLRNMGVEPGRTRELILRETRPGS